MRRHVVIILVDRLDLAAARAVQYARTLMPDELRAVHFAVDPREAAKLEAEWSRLGLSRLPLDLVDCPDRRLVRAALELAAQILAQDDTELSVVMPRRAFATAWQRILHDRTADRIAAAVSQLPHANATIVPFQLSNTSAQHRAKALLERTGARRARPAARPAAHPADELTPKVAGTTPISEAQWRARVRVAGRIHSVRVPAGGATANLECTLVDASGAILLVFQGRRHIPGVQQGARLVARGMVGAWQGQLALLSPAYELLAGPKEADAPASL